jgi:K+/H+ antiporter YhaU regulatory subunit KhtT
VKDRVTSPVYAQIAFNIAKRIADGDLKEHTRIFGRSILSSEYGVSPETIRRSLRLLADMGIVEIRQNSGGIILSQEKAKQYILRFNEYMDIRGLQRKLRELMSEQEKTSREILSIADAIVYTNEKFHKYNLFQAYEAIVPSGSPLSGLKLTEVGFWQHTGATVIAIRRDDKTILSPDPKLELQDMDKIVYIGNITTIDAMEAFLKDPVILNYDNG